MDSKVAEYLSCVREDINDEWNLVHEDNEMKVTMNFIKYTLKSIYIANSLKYNFDMTIRFIGAN